MRLIVISSPDKFDSELKLIPKFFDCGLEVFHLRKPKFSYRRMNKYLSLFPREYLDKVVIHSHFRLAFKYKLRGVHVSEKRKKKKFLTWLRVKIMKILRPGLAITSSFHSISDLLRDKKNYQYVFLSPVFDSISKKSYRSSFNEGVLKKALADTPHPVIALGGVKAENIYKAKEFGFAGVAVLGSIWGEDKEPVKNFLKIRDICRQKDLKILPLDLEL